MIRRNWTRPRADDGVYSILYVVLVLALGMSAALVVDLSILREDRRLERLAADAAATAAAIELSPLDGSVSPNAACVAAWSYLKLNLPGASAAVTACPSTQFPLTFSGSCPGAAPPQPAQPAGEWWVTITWPVHNTDPLMTYPNVTAGDGYQQPVVNAADGTDACQRIGVSVSRTRSASFAGIGGNGANTTVNSSVARASLEGDTGLEFPLVVLDQEGCGVITAQGSGPQQGAIRVLSNGLTPGRIAIDSDGSKLGAAGGNQHGCNGGATTAEAGGGGRIQAYNGTGGDPGLIYSQTTVPKTTSSPCAAGTDPATAPLGTVCPIPIGGAQRVTRSPWDWKYHCSTALALPLSRPCTLGRPDYISLLRADLGTLDATNATSRGYTVTPATANDAAVCDDPDQFNYFDIGNWFINCDTFNVNNTTFFAGGGTVVFKGRLNIQATGSGLKCLSFNQPVTGTLPPPVVGGKYPQCAPTTTAVLSSGAPDMTVYLRGDLTRANADFVAPQTFIYQETDPARGGHPEFRIDLGAGTASNLLLTAPLNGNFKNLALWSENTAGVTNSESQANQLGSQNKFGIEGILFLPKSLTNFGGDPSYIGSARAQFVTFRVSVSGGGTLELTPDAARAELVQFGGVKLIR